MVTMNTAGRMQARPTQDIQEICLNVLAEAPNMMITMATTSRTSLQDKKDAQMSNKAHSWAEMRQLTSIYDRTCSMCGYGIERNREC